MYRCESWTVKKAEHQRNDAFELWHWRRLLRVPWTARRSNQSFLKEINPEYSLEGLMLKLSSNILATWCEELTHWKTLWCWERLKAEGEEGNEDEMVGRHHRFNGHEFEQTPGDSGGQGGPGVLQSTGSRRVKHDLVTEQQFSSVLFKWTYFIGISFLGPLAPNGFQSTLCLTYWGLSSIFPGGTMIKIPSANTGDTKKYELHPWVGKIPWRREWLLTPVFLPGEFHA